ncbi:hypothetical protein QQX98_007820 [Neonectria punicea]|uniref:CFEM domain-containing protein n=1 Tax=Neonectria punicea TaxID=979145 RepID=A0ABR1GWU6_9HYPO
MKTFMLSPSIFALVQLATAQKACLSLTTLFPDCAYPCVTSAGSAVGCTVSTDLVCRCDPVSSRSIQALAVGCVIAACIKAGELGSALAAGLAICGCAATAIPDATTTSEALPETTTTSEAPLPDTTTDLTTTTTALEATTNLVTTTEDTTGPITTTTSAEDSATTGYCDTESPCQASFDAVPDCAESCLSSAAVTEANRSSDDYECQCSSTAALNVLNAVSSLCSCVEASPSTPCTETATEPPRDTTTKSEVSQTSETATETETTKSEDTTEEPTCTAGTAKDCGPVASTAIPECAQACFTSAAPSIGCDVDDNACQCEEEAQASLSQLLIPCVLTACDSGDLPAIITGASSVCACATAAPPAGECTITDDGTATTTESATKPPSNTKPPVTETEATTSACPDATTVDCGPVATSAVPECAHACFSAAAPNVGCDVYDYVCQSKDEVLASMSQLLIPCVATACDPGDLPAVITGASSVCACAQADPTGGCATGSPPDDTATAGPTKTGDHGGDQTTTCAEATISDCGPVASSVIPACAQACFSSAAPNVGCGVDDYACQCEDDAQASLSQLLVPCVATACDSDQLAGVITGSSSVCACATAPPSGDDCDGGSGNNGKPTKTGDFGNPSEPTDGSGGDGEGSTCVSGPLTTAGCAPVASSAVPSCAHACFSSAAPDVSCGVDDYACQCEADAQASLSQLLVPCVATACDSDQLAAVITGASSVCACATAAPSGRNCQGSGDGGGSGSDSASEPTGGSGGDGEASTYVPGTLTAADCAPVASPAVPSCANACFSFAAPGVGCGVDDYACQCEAEAQASLSQLLVPCVATACDPDQLAAVITGASAVCACAQAVPTGDNECESGSGGSGGGDEDEGENGDGDDGVTTCVTVSKFGSGGEVTKSTSCYCASGGQTLTKQSVEPTGKIDNNKGDGSGGEDGEESGSESESPSSTGEPVVVIGSGARFEIGIVAGIFGGF